MVSSVTFPPKTLLLNCSEQITTLFAGPGRPVPLVNGHCVCPATDTWAFVEERSPGGVTVLLNVHVLNNRALNSVRGKLIELKGE